MRCALAFPLVTLVNAVPASAKTPEFGKLYKGREGCFVLIDVASGSMCANWASYVQDRFKSLETLLDKGCVDISPGYSKHGLNITLSDLRAPRTTSRTWA